MNEEKQVAIQDGIDAEVLITLEKKAGEPVFRRKIEASSAPAALNGIALLVLEFSNMIGRPADHVLALLATVILTP